MLGKFFAGAFALFLAGSTYVSSYFVRHHKTRWAGGVGLVVFGIADLWFNEATVVYYTSAAALVGPESNFLGIAAESIRYFMQWTALGFGLLPTVGSAVLGWMQAGAGEVTALNKPGLTARIANALGKIIVSWAGGFAVKVESMAKVSPQLSAQENRQEGGYDWRRLTDAQRAELEGKDTRKIKELYPGIDERTALNWRNRANIRKLS